VLVNPHEESMELSPGHLVLCRIQYVHSPKVNALEFARLEPIYYEHEGRWARVDDKRTMFPDEGLVFWWKPPDDVRKQFWIWKVALIPQPKYDGTKNRDRYQVKEGFAFPIEEFVGGKYGISEEQLTLLLDEGVDLSVPPLGKVLFRLEDGRCVGPLDLTLNSGRWTYPDSESRGRIPVRSTKGLLLDTIDEAGRSRSVLPPRAEMAPHSGYINVQSALDVLHGLLKRVRRLDAQAFEALHITYKTYDAYLLALERAQIPGDQALMDRARSDRVKQVLQVMKTDATALKDVIDAFSAQPEVTARINEGVRAQITELIKDAEIKIANELEDRRSALEKLELEIRARKKQLDDFRSEALAMEKAAVDQHRKLAEEFANTLDELMTRPAASIAEHVLFQSVMKGGGRNLTAEQGNAAASVPMMSFSSDPSGTELTDFAMTRGSLIKKLSGTDLSVFAATVALGAALGGAVPFMFGPGADELLSAIADVVAAGRLIRIPISAATYQVQDLFGRQDRSSGRFIEAPGSLSILEREVASSKSLVILVLEGVNRAPVEVFFPPLLASVTTVGAGQKQARIPTVSFAGAPASFAWPENVLLFCTLVEGPAAFPLPRAIMDHVMVMPTWLGPLIPSCTDPASMDVSWLSRGQWAAERRTVAVTGCSSAAVSSIDRLAKPISVGRTNSLRLIGGIEKVLGDTGSLSVAVTVASRWLPGSNTTESRDLSQRLAPDLKPDWVKTAANAATAFMWDGAVGGAQR
jgi:hypothetical protein